MIISISNTKAMMADETLMAFEGDEKKRRATRRFPTVKVVYEKSKKPDPRVCMPGGEMNIETSNKTHQRKVMTRKRTVT
jgi:hypothetical protein